MSVARPRADERIASLAIEERQTARSLERHHQRLRKISQHNVRRNNVDAPTKAALSDAWRGVGAADVSLLPGRHVGLDNLLGLLGRLLLGSGGRLRPQPASLEHQVQADSGGPPVQYLGQPSGVAPVLPAPG